LKTRIEKELLHKAKPMQQPKNSPKKQLEYRPHFKFERHSTEFNKNWGHAVLSKRTEHV